MYARPADELQPPLCNASPSRRLSSMARTNLLGNSSAPPSPPHTHASRLFTLRPLPPPPALRRNVVMLAMHIHDHSAPPPPPAFPRLMNIHEASSGPGSELPALRLAVRQRAGGRASGRGLALGSPRPAGRACVCVCWGGGGGGTGGRRAGWNPETPTECSGSPHNPLERPRRTPSASPFSSPHRRRRHRRRLPPSPHLLLRRCLRSWGGGGGERAT